MKALTAEQLGKLSASKLELLEGEATLASSLLCDEFIRVGRGSETYSESFAKAKEGDELAVRWTANHKHLSELIAERNRRLSHHGSTKPIKVK